MEKLVVILYVCVLTTWVRTHRAPTVYDVLSLVYKLCATKDLRQNIECLEEHLSKKVTPSLHHCFPGESIDTTKRTKTPKHSVEDIVKVLCLRSTFVFQWRETHQKTPLPLTMVIGLTALRRMACVIEEVHRPLSTWEFAFSKCFAYESVKKVQNS
ncbi:uncharacterized protein LOC111085500, partial [Limulus polyphemus]|uniref:Uncharacterized protein LOC111085500 n=1 Tax=Limulus polyphemus TaxID=6850 RepID=A0ABM1S8U7_LIMPO